MRRYAPLSEVLAIIEDPKYSDKQKIDVLRTEMSHRQDKIDRLSRKSWWRTLFSSLEQAKEENVALGEKLVVLEEKERQAAAWSEMGNKVADAALNGILNWLGGKIGKCASLHVPSFLSDNY